ncbi:hypothetical protein ABOM_005689 [Aspergillus bombycis]|uniref:Condensation domain-containing protein n=1 Tax=Aspergillus bombycis TaxID=109264 RepID=A0A1F8A477_9EURO|nr:hypothetical protein ABOM_005689 [Aspergillus bombycis]OGM46108.1 hypothetical protein ABOM_005689 [Aspergillus bombycis]
MSWTKVSERRWERPVTGMEGYFVYTGAMSAALYDGRHQYTIFSKLKVDLDINPADIESALKHAWKQLRSEQPQIATTVDGTTMVYEVPDEAAVQEWLASTFVVSSAADAEQLYRNVEPIKQVTLYYIPKSSELVLRAQHYTIDGIGTLLLWDRYLTALTTPVKATFGDEHTRLAPSIEEVLKVSEPTPEETEKATALLMRYATKVPGIGPVSKVGTVPAGRSQNAEMTFPTRTTEAIIKTCKEKGISVTSAVHAAYIQAIIKHANPSGTLSRYANLGLFNLRPYLPKPYSTNEYAASVYYTPLPLDMDLPSQFWETAHALDNYYRTTVKNDPEILPLHAHMTRVLCQATQMPEYQGGPIPGDAQVSSLGVAERYIQHTYGSTVRVLDVKLGVDIVLGMTMLFIYTFRDQLHLVYSFNDGYEEPAHISMYLEEVQKVLIEELLA